MKENSCPLCEAGESCQKLKKLSFWRSCGNVHRPIDFQLCFCPGQAKSLPSRGSMFGDPQNYGLSIGDPQNRGIVEVQMWGLVR